MARLIITGQSGPYDNYGQNAAYKLNRYHTLLNEQGMPAPVRFPVLYTQSAETARADLLGFSQEQLKFADTNSSNGLDRAEVKALTGKPSLGGPMFDMALYLGMNTDAGHDAYNDRLFEVVDVDKNGHMDGNEMAAYNLYKDAPQFWSRNWFKASLGEGGANLKNPYQRPDGMHTVQDRIRAMGSIIGSPFETGRVVKHIYDLLGFGAQA